MIILILVHILYLKHLLFLIERYLRVLGDFFLRDRFFVEKAVYDASLEKMLFNYLMDIGFVNTDIKRALRIYRYDRPLLAETLAACFNSLDFFVELLGNDLAFEFFKNFFRA